MGSGVILKHSMFSRVYTRYNVFTHCCWLEQIIAHEIKMKFIHFVFILNKISYMEMSEKQTVYTARSQPDNRDIWITGGRITDVQLYSLQSTSLKPKGRLYQKFQKMW